VAGALKLTFRVDAKPESAGSGNVINISIETRNESLTNNPENTTLRALKPPDSKTGEPETRTKIGHFPGWEVLHACTLRPRRGILAYPVLFRL